MACRSKESSSSTSQQTFVDLSMRMRGGVNCEAKAQVLVFMHPPLFPGSRLQKGGRNSGAVR